MIRARAHSDDYVYDVAFDATDYFRTAEPADIVDLANEEWSNGYPADYVALHSEDTGPEELRALFNYVRGRRGIGFECEVSEGDALTWLKENRQDVFAAVEAKQ